MRYINQLYVDSVGVEDLTERAIVNMLEDLGVERDNIYLDDFGG